MANILRNAVIGCGLAGALRGGGGGAFVGAGRLCRPLCATAPRRVMPAIAATPTFRGYWPVPLGLSGGL